MDQIYLWSNAIMCATAVPVQTRFGMLIDMLLWPLWAPTAVGCFFAHPSSLYTSVRTLRKYKIHTCMSGSNSSYMLASRNLHSDKQVYITDSSVHNREMR